jgi:hypothetical protein
MATAVVARALRNLRGGTRNPSRHRWRSCSDGFVVLTFQKPEEGARDRHAGFEHGARMLKQQVQHGVHIGYTQQGVYLMGHVMPYSPIHPAQEPATQEDMWAKLARNAKPEVKITPDAAQSPKEKSAPLEWQKPVRTSPQGAGYVLTVCGRFSISKDGHEMGFTYTAWKRDTEPATNLGAVRTREEAEKLCEAAR